MLNVRAQALTCQVKVESANVIHNSGGISLERLQDSQSLLLLLITTITARQYTGIHAFV